MMRMNLTRFQPAPPSAGLFSIFFLTFTFSLFPFSSPALQAQSSTADILQVKFFYDAVEFEKAISAGREILSSGQTFAPDELLFLHRYVALSYYNIGQVDSARTHFLSLLSVDPGYELDPVTVSPKIIDFFKDIKKDYQALAGSGPGPAYTRYVFVEDLRPGAAWRSMILPGWGQFYKHQKTKGYILGGAFWGSLLATGISLLQESAARDKYLESSTPEEIARTYSDYDQWHKTRQVFTIASAALWAAAVGDALWSPYSRASLAARPEGGVLLTLQIQF